MSDLEIIQPELFANELLVQPTHLKANFQSIIEQVNSLSNERSVGSQPGFSYVGAKDSAEFVISPGNGVVVGEGLSYSFKVNDEVPFNDVIKIKTTSTDEGLPVVTNTGSWLKAGDCRGGLLILVTKEATQWVTPNSFTESPSTLKTPVPFRDASNYALLHIPAGLHVPSMWGGGIIHSDTQLTVDVTKYNQEGGLLASAPFSSGRDYHLYILGQKKGKYVCAVLADTLELTEASLPVAEEAQVQLFDNVRRLPYSFRSRNNVIPHLLVRGWGLDSCWLEYASSAKRSGVVSLPDRNDEAETPDDYTILDTRGVYKRTGTRPLIEFPFGGFIPLGVTEFEGTIYGTDGELSVFYPEYQEASAIGEVFASDVPHVATLHLGGNRRLSFKQTLGEWSIQVNSYKVEVS